MSLSPAAPSRTAVPARSGQVGLTLVELLVTLAVVTILAGAAVPMYLGYTKDARTAEGKALAGSAFTALQGCAQIRNGKLPVCELADIARSAGVDPATGTTGDGRWTLSVVPPGEGGPPPPTFIGVIGVVGVTGQATDGIEIGLHVSSAGWVLRCRLTANTVPALAEGDAC